ncbi:choice-of-anchor D domain-containing protein [Cystobacter fuscus]|uniref:choice-of-anchor D domain-containing protein n=1 Tax=Cystobacter fuscus TaxID=43 RepID=UPI0037C16A0C
MSQTAGTKVTVKVLLNEVELGNSFSSTTRTCSSNNGCDSSISVTKTGGIVWKASGNELRLHPDNAAYCISKVVLTFSVVQRLISVSPESLPFGKQKKDTLRVLPLTLTNGGDADLTVDKLEITGSGKGAYQIIDPSTPDADFTVSKNGGTKVIKVQFSPDVVSPSFPAELVITSNATNPTSPVPLSGEGVEFATALSETLLDFSDVLVGKDVTRDVEVSNVGALTSGNITISNFAVTSGSGFTLVSPTETSIVLQPGGKTKLTVKFKPAGGTTEPVPGALTFSISGDGNHTSARVDLKGRGVQPNLGFDPGLTLPFGDQRVGVARTLKLKVTNTGLGSITFQNIEVSGNSDYSLVSPSSAQLEARSGSTEILVQYKPSAESNSTTPSGTLTLTSDDATYPSVQVTLTGKGVRPRLSVPGTLSFGDQRVSVAQSKMLVVTNTGSAPITLKNFSVSGSDYSLVSSSLPVELEARTGSTEIVVQFRPSVESTASTPTSSGTLSFTSDDTDYPSPQVSLTGRGVKPRLTVSPEGPLAFDEQRVGEPRTLKLTVRNTGSGPITFNAFEVLGSSDYSLVSPSLPADVAALNGSREFTVQFLPTSESSTTSITGTLILKSPDPDIPSVQASLTGKGVRPALEVGSTRVVFEPQDVGVVSTPKMVKLTNTGSGTLHITEISVTGPFSVSPRPSVDVAGIPQDLSVTFTPNALGVNEGSLSFKSNDPAKPSVSLPLSGTGVSTLSVSPALLEFGSVAKGKSLEKTLVITNNSQHPIVVQPLVLPAPLSSTLTSARTLQPGSSSVEVRVRFSPTTQVDLDQEFTVESDATNAPKLKVTGKGTAPIIRFVLPGQDQSVLDFPEVPLNELRTQTVKIENTGDSKLTLTSVGMDPNGDKSFTNQAPSKYELEPGGTPIEVKVSFRAAASGRFFSVLRVVSDAMNNPAELNLSGTGVAPEIKVAEGLIDFGPQKVLAESPKQQLVISNPGKATLKISGLTLDPNFIVSPSDFPWDIPAEGSKTLLLSFKPLASGPVNGKLIISSNAVGKPSVNVPVAGLGVDGFPDCKDGCDIIFPTENVGSSHNEVLTIVNTARIVGGKDTTVDLVLRTANVSVPSGENPFEIGGFTQNTKLTSGEAKSFSVKFQPTARGPYKGTITFETDSATTPRLNVTLTAHASGPQLQVAPLVDFGNVNVESSRSVSLPVTNVGELPLNIHRVDFEGKLLDGGVVVGDDMALDYSSDLAAGGITVSADGGTGSIPLKFTPRAVGLREARAIISSNVSPVAVGLKGRGTSQVLTADPAELTIGGVLVGSTSPERKIELQNGGTAAVEIQSITLSSPELKDVFIIYPTLESSEDPLSVASGGMLPIYVSFKPTADIQSASTWLRVKPVNARLPSVDIKLVGNGVLHPVTAPSTLAFGKQLLNARAHHELPLTNLTNTPVSVRDVSIQGDGCTQFTVDLPREPIPSRNSDTNTPGKSNLNVYFQPRATGVSVTCQMVVSFVEFFKDPVTVTLSGEGIPAVLSIEPAALDFGGVRAGNARRGQLVFKNLGSDPITLDEPQVLYSVGTSFEISPNPLKGVSIKAGESLVVDVDYKPKTGTDISSETRLGIKTSTPSMSQSLEVSFKGKSTQRILNVDPGSLDFDRVDVNGTKASQTVTVRNISSQLQLAVVTVNGANGPFGVVTDGLTSGIPAQGSATFTVTFDPEVAGEVEDHVSIRLQDATEAEVLLPVKGSGRTLVGRGTGCSSGSAELGSAGLLGLLALLGLRVRRRRHG